MLLRLLFLFIGFLGTIPLLYMMKIGGAYDLSHYRYATIGLFAGIFGFLFGIEGLLIGGILGYFGFKFKEITMCNIIDSFAKKIKPLVEKINIPHLK